MRHFHKNSSCRYMYFSYDLLACDSINNFASKFTKDISRLLFYYLNGEKMFLFGVVSVMTVVGFHRERDEIHYRVGFKEWTPYSTRIRSFFVLFLRFLSVDLPQNQLFTVKS